MNTKKLDLGAATDVGKVRSHNEDAFAIVQSAAGDALLVCDGMGGHSAGDIASNAARTALAGALLDLDAADPRERLYRSIEQAHERVVNLSREARERSGMGTTCVAAWVCDGRVFLGNVGDSRAYLVRNRRATQLSIDHTRVQKLVDQGMLTKEEAAKHPDAGVLTQALGQEKAVTPWVLDQAVALRAGDTLVLCTDGVYDCLSEADFVSLASVGTATDAANTLVRVATERDGNDNATAAVARLAEGEGDIEVAGLSTGFAKWKQVALVATAATVLFVAGIAVGNAGLWGEDGPAEAQHDGAAPQLDGSPPDSSGESAEESQDTEESDAPPKSDEPQEDSSPEVEGAQPPVRTQPTPSAKPQKTRKAKQEKREDRPGTGKSSTSAPAKSRAAAPERKKKKKLSGKTDGPQPTPPNTKPATAKPKSPPTAVLPTAGKPQTPPSEGPKAK